MAPKTSGLSQAQRRILLLLVISALVNFIDRGMLSVAAPALGSELGLNPSQLGYLLSAFFWTYAGFQLITGWLVDRFSAGLLYAAGFCVWSGATLLTGFARNYGWIFAMRLLLGIGESVAYPAYARILARDFPERRRGFANALIDAAGKAGPGAGTFFGAMIVAAWGWRAMFVGIGALSLIWIPFWVRSAPEHQNRSSCIKDGPGIFAIVSRRAPWATFVGLFCFNYAYFFLMTWLPSYLVMERRFSLSNMAIFGALPFLVCACSSAAAGWASDSWIARGATPNVARKTFAGSGLLISAAALPASALAPDAIAMGLLLVAFVAIGLFTSNVWAITQNLAGPDAAGRWTGLQNAIGNLGSVAAPIVTGWIVEATGGYFLIAFLAASALLLFAAALYLAGIGKIEPLVWRANQY